MLKVLISFRNPVTHVAGIILDEKATVALQGAAPEAHCAIELNQIKNKVVLCWPKCSSWSLLVKRP